MRYIEICPDNSQRDVSNPYDEEFFKEFSLRDWVSWNTESGFMLSYEDFEIMKKIKKRNLTQY